MAPFSESSAKGPNQVVFIFLNQIKDLFIIFFSRNYFFSFDFLNSTKIDSNFGMSFIISDLLNDEKNFLINYKIIKKLAKVLENYVSEK